MKILFYLGIIVIIGSIYARLSKRKDSKVHYEAEENAENQAEQTDETTTEKEEETKINISELKIPHAAEIKVNHDMVIDALKQLGCNIQGDDGKWITFLYQGGNFHIDCDPVYIRVWNPNFTHILQDNPDVYIWRTAVNRINMISKATMIMQYRERLPYFLHNRVDLILFENCPYVKWIQNALSECFRNQRRFHTLVQRLKLSLQATTENLN